jgi:hypothetical protein
MSVGLFVMIVLLNRTAGEKGNSMIDGWVLVLIYFLNIIIAGWLINILCRHNDWDQDFIICAGFSIGIYVLFLFFVLYQIIFFLAKRSKGFQVDGYWFYVEYNDQERVKFIKVSLIEFSILGCKIKSAHSYMLNDVTLAINELVEELLDRKYKLTEKNDKAKEIAYEIKEFRK